MTRISSGPDRLANWLGRHLGSPRVLSETQLRRRELAVAKHRAQLHSDINGV